MTPCRCTDPVPVNARWDRERGSGGASLIWVVLWPAVLLLIFGGIQFAVHSYTATLALSAAQAGVREAAAYPPSADRGRQAAETFLLNQAATSLRDTVVSVDMSAESVSVIVVGTSQSLVPGMTFTVRQQAAAALEDTR